MALVQRTICSILTVHASSNDKSKPAARRGRRARDLTEIAQPPKRRPHRASFPHGAAKSSGNPDRGPGRDRSVHPFSPTESRLALTASMRDLHGENVVPGTESAKPRILVVDDDLSTVQIISKMLDRLGYGMSGVAASGEEALQKAAETKPDLVLMDIVLSGAMDGTEAAVRMHHEMHLPVIYLTGSADNETLQRAKQAEPFGYLVKPVGTDELNSALTIGLHNARIWHERRLAKPAWGDDSPAPHSHDVALGEAQLAAAVTHLWQQIVNYFERWNEYNQAFLSGHQDSATPPLEETTRVLVVLAERELKHSIEITRDILLSPSNFVSAESSRVAKRLLSACEAYFEQLGTCDDVTREFQERKARLEQVERECTLVNFAREQMRRAARTLKFAPPLSSTDAE